MPRTARIVIPNVPHHITHRGNNRQDVFFADDDRRAYLAVLGERCADAGVRVLGYCLMSNHVHLIVVPPTEESLAAAIGRTHFVHTQYVNRLHGRSGHLWQGRFYSCPLDETHLWRAVAYVERNPVRAGLVRRAWRWPWSSAAAHVGESAGAREKAAATDLLDMKWWAREWTAARWRTQLVTPEDEGWRRQFWRAAHTGRPLAEDRWLARVEARLGCRLRANPVGRPRRQKSAEKTGGRSATRRRKTRK